MTQDLNNWAEGNQNNGQTPAPQQQPQIPQQPQYPQPQYPTQYPAQYPQPQQAVYPQPQYQQPHYQPQFQRRSPQPPPYTPEQLKAWAAAVTAALLLLGTGFLFGAMYERVSDQAMQEVNRYG